MNIAAAVNKIGTNENVSTGQPDSAKKGNESAFEAIYQSAIGLLEETNRYTHQAEEAQMAFALGLNDNIHDLMVAQSKANISLQYTVAIRNAILEAYKELTQMQF